MSLSTPIRRRTVLKRFLLALAGITTGMAGSRLRSQQPERLSPDDPMAQQLMYVEDATQAPADQRASTEFCYNCQFFQGQQQTGEAPCLIFMGKLVKAQAWCSTWTAKQPAAMR